MENYLYEEDFLLNVETKEEKEQKRLDAFAEFPVWTLEQLKEHLHIDFDTLQKYVAQKVLHKFNVGRCTFYSTVKKKYTNAAIAKSILMIDSKYMLDYSKYSVTYSDAALDDKSLVARNVKYIGHLGTSVRWDMYQVFVPQEITEKDYEKFVKLLIDIHNNNEHSDYIHVVFVVRNMDVTPLDEYLGNAPQLVPYRMCQYMAIQYFPCNRPHFKYLKV